MPDQHVLNGVTEKKIKKKVQTITKQEIMSCTLVYTEMAKHQWKKCQDPVSVLL